MVVVSDAGAVNLNTVGWGEDFAKLTCSRSYFFQNGVLEIRI